MDANENTQKSMTQEYEWERLRMQGEGMNLKMENTKE